MCIYIYRIQLAFFPLISVCISFLGYCVKSNVHCKDSLGGVLLSPAKMVNVSLKWLSQLSKVTFKVTLSFFLFLRFSMRCFLQPNMCMWPQAMV